MPLRDVFISFLLLPFIPGIEGFVSRSFIKPRGSFTQRPGVTKLGAQPNKRYFQDSDEVRFWNSHFPSDSELYQYPSVAEDVDEQWTCLTKYSHLEELLRPVLNAFLEQDDIVNRLFGSQDYSSGQIAYNHKLMKTNVKLEFKSNWEYQKMRYVKGGEKLMTLLIHVPNMSFLYTSDKCGMSGKKSETNPHTIRKGKVFKPVDWEKLDNSEYPQLTVVTGFMESLIKRWAKNSQDKVTSIDFTSCANYICREENRVDLKNIATFKFQDGKEKQFCCFLNLEPGKPTNRKETLEPWVRKGGGGGFDMREGTQIDVLEN